MSNELVNETMAVVVLLPDDACNTYVADGPRFIPIVQEDGQMRGALPFGYWPAWALITEVCRARASRTPGGALRVDGRRIEPDAYIRRWRAAIANATPLCDVRAHSGCNWWPPSAGQRARLFAA